MGVLRGLLYHLRGLRLGLTTGRLLFWGLMRFALILLILSALIGLILAFQDKIMNLLWTKPASPWIVWLWYVLSGVVSLFLMVLSTVFSYLISQVFFSVLIMDHMSKITEWKVTGNPEPPTEISWVMSIFHLLGQEIPRTVVPVLLSMAIMVIGWVTPLGPLVTLFSAALTILFLSWDNTDLVPARQRIPFRARFGFFLKTLPFHLGFGLPFLIPVLNILALSFAPVGATLYWIETRAGQENKPSRPGEATVVPIRGEEVLRSP